MKWIMFVRDGILFLADFLYSLLRNQFNVIFYILNPDQIWIVKKVNKNTTECFCS